jgi:IS605 OrfB family transposase
MIRRVGHTLKFATAAKRQKLDEFFAEYARVVNAFIVLYWNTDMLPGKANSSVYGQVDSWMMGKARKCAVNQAIRILKSVRKKDKQKTYRAYQRVYAKAKKLNRNVFGILSYRWAEWSKGRMFRHRVRMPVFNGNTIDLNSDLVRIQDASNSSEFDLWIRLGSIFGNRESLILPTKHHEQSRHFEKTGWTQRKSLTLRRDPTGRYYADLYWKKAGLVTNQQGSAVGVDIGINKLMTCSDGTELGTDLRAKLDKLNRRKQNSRNWNQTRREIKDYIGYVTNRFPWPQVDVVVMENILNITKSTKGRVNKTVRKMLGHWNIDLLYRRMQDKAEENRVFLAFVEPAYTSQTCNSCGAIDKKSRNGEVFKCTACGYADDADVNGAKNILQRFLDEQFTVARGTKRMEGFSIFRSTVGRKLGGR